MDLKTWARCTAAKTVRTVFQTFAGVMSSAVLLSQVDWKLAVSSSLVSGLYCVVMAISNAPKTEAEKQEEAMQ